MEKQEVHALLVQISHIDQRIVDAGTVHMWSEIIGRYGYGDARDAVPICFMESDAYLTPHRLIAVMKRLKENRATENAKRVIYDKQGTDVPMPDNFREMSDFFRELYQTHPEPEGKSVESMAGDLGWEIPVAVWSEVEQEID